MLINSMVEGSCDHNSMVKGSCVYVYVYMLYVRTCFLQNFMLGRGKKDHACQHLIINHT